MRLRGWYLTALLFQQKEDEVTQMKGETARLNKMRETIQRKLRNVEDQKADVEQQKETLKSQIIGLERGRCSNNYMYNQEAKPGAK